MNCQWVMLLVVLTFMAFACQVGETVAFLWGCSNYSGVCRPVCLPTELPFGPFGCGKGFVQQIPWCCKEESYRDQDKKGLYMEALRCQLHLFSGHVYTDDDLKKKLKNLRTTFSSLYKAWQERRSGSGADEVPYPKWRFYNQLLFLKDSFEQVESSDNLSFSEPHPPSPNPSCSSPVIEGGCTVSSEDTPIAKKGEKRPAERIPTKADEALDFAMSFLKNKLELTHGKFLDYLSELLNDVPDTK